MEIWAQTTPNKDSLMAQDAKVSALAELLQHYKGGGETVFCKKWQNEEWVTVRGSWGVQSGLNMGPWKD